MALASYPNVSLYLDQAPLAFPTTASQTGFDLERVEVVKGPQGTLFGRNTAAGAVSIVTKRPSDQVEGRARLRAGNYGKRYVDGMLNLPAGEAVALSPTLPVRLRIGNAKGAELSFRGQPVNLSAAARDNIANITLP